MGYRGAALAVSFSYILQMCTLLALILGMRVRDLAWHVGCISSLQLHSPAILYRVLPVMGYLILKFSILCHYW